jgi:hypothetical protein
MNMAERSTWKSKCELKLCPPLLVQRAVALAPDSASEEISIIRSEEVKRCAQRVVPRHVVVLYRVVAYIRIESVTLCSYGSRFGS